MGEKPWYVYGLLKIATFLKEIPQPLLATDIDDSIGLADSIWELEAILFLLIYRKTELTLNSLTIHYFSFDHNTKSSTSSD